MTIGAGGTVDSGPVGSRHGRSAISLHDALALVTGAGSGIGRATALALAARGARLLAVDVDETSAKQTATECGGEAFAVDVADATAVEALAAAVEAAHGPLDVLVNNAGVGMSGRFLDTTLGDWDWNWILGVNLLGVVHGCLAFGPRMVARGGGHVVNVSSALGYTPRASEPAYVTTKAAVLSLSRCLRADWARRGVGVSVVCPGVIATPIIEHTRFRGAQARPENVARLRRAFARRGHPPAAVARAVIDAAARNRAVVPVGPEAWAGWFRRGLVPTRLEDRLAVLGAVTDA